MKNFLEISHIRMFFMADAPRTWEISVSNETNVPKLEVQPAEAYKARIRSEILWIKEILKVAPNDKQALAHLDKIASEVKRLSQLRQYKDVKKLEIEQDSALKIVEFKDEIEKARICAEIQTDLAALKDDILAKKVKAEGIEVLSTNEKIAYFSDLDGQGGVQEFNTKKEEGALWWKKEVYGQKYIVSEKQIEISLKEMVGNDVAKLQTIISRIAGESFGNANYESVRTKFAKNLIESLEFLAYLAEGIGGIDYRAGLNAVLQGTEKDFIKKVYDKNPAKAVARIQEKAPLLSQEGIMAAGVTMALNFIGIPAVMSASKSETGTNEAGSTNPEKKQNVEGRFSFFGVEIGLNLNDRNAEIRGLANERRKFFQATLLNDGSWFKPQSDINAAIDALPDTFSVEMKNQLKKQFASMRALLGETQDTPDDIARRKRYIAAMENACVRATIDTKAKQEMGNGTKFQGVSIGLALFVIPFLKFNFQKISQEIVAGEKNEGTKMDLFKTKSNLNTLLITETRDMANSAAITYVLTPEKYKNIPVVISDELEKSGVVFDKKLLSISAPAGKKLRFDLRTFGNTGAQELHVVGMVEDGQDFQSQNLGDIPSRQLDTFLSNPKTRLALSELAGINWKRKGGSLADVFSREYSAWNGQSNSIVSDSLKKSAVAVLGTSERAELRKLVITLQKTTNPEDVLKIVESVRYGMMTDYTDLVAMDKKGKHGYRGDHAKYASMINEVSKSQISGKQFKDALAIIEKSGLQASDFATVLDAIDPKISRSKKERLNLGEARPNLVAMVAGWKLNPPSMDYKAPGLAKVQGEYLRETNDVSKRGKIYDAFMTSPVFQKQLGDILARANMSLSPVQTKQLITNEVVELSDGRTVSMNNKFFFFAYEACLNPSIGIELGKTIKITNAEGEEQVVSTLENTVGNIQNNTAKYGAGITAPSVLHRHHHSGSRESANMSTTPTEHTGGAVSTTGGAASTGGTAPIVLGPTGSGFGG